MKSDQDRQAGTAAAIVASAQDWAKANIKGRNNVISKIVHDTIADRAAMSGASRNTQQMADKVAKASPELAQQVAHGEKTLPDAMEELTGKRPGAKPKPVVSDEVIDRCRCAAEARAYFLGRAAAEVPKLTEIPNETRKTY